MFKSLRFRLPALFLVGILLAGVVATLIAIRFFQSYTSSRAVDELRSESVGIAQLYARQAGVQEVPVEKLAKAIGGDRIFFIPIVPGAELRPMPGREPEPGALDAAEARARFPLGRPGGDLERVRQRGVVLADAPPPGAEVIWLGDVDLAGIGAALERFGQVDTLINNAGVFISKPFTDYSAADYALITGVNLAGFFWLTRLAIAEMLRRGHGHVVNISATIADQADSGSRRPHQGRLGRGYPVTGHRVRVPRHPGQRRRARRRRDASDRADQEPSRVVLGVRGQERARALGAAG